MRDNLVQGSSEPAGYRRLIELAGPLLVSMGAYSLMQLSDRMFLSWRSTEELAAVVPASAMVLVCVTLFLGTSFYASNLVAQYFGAGRPKEIGKVVWAAIWIGVLGQAFILLVALFAEPLFQLFGHAPRVTELEVQYFTICAFGAGPQMASGALSSLYSGRGKTRPVMWMGLFGAGLNIPLNDALIFGNWGAPELGMRGAALATILCQWIGFLIWARMVFQKSHEEEFGVRSQFGLNLLMLRRLVRFGLPSGVHFLLDGGAWTAFALIVGRLGVVQLGASNIAWQLHTLALLPAIGIGAAGGILVGQFQGAKKADLAQVVTRHALHLGLGYIAILAGLFLVIPDIFVAPFGNRADPLFSDVAELAASLLTFVAFLGVSHTVQMIYASSLKGAGDVRYIISVLAFAGPVGFVLPLIAFLRLGAPLRVFWLWFIVQTALVAWLFARRFRSGAWQAIRMIDDGPLPAEPLLAEPLLAEPLLAEPLLAEPVVAVPSSDP